MSIDEIVDVSPCAHYPVYVASLLFAAGCHSLKDELGSRMLEK